MTWMIVGLGNPGAKYDQTRHNVGFMVAERLASQAGASFSRAKQMDALVAETLISKSGLGVVPGEKLVIVQPTTYMNESGRAVGKLAKFYAISAERIIVVHDELDLDLGQLRLKKGGGDNGHNGLKSVRAHLGTGDYYRVRFGIGRPPGAQDTISWVLSRFPAKIRPEVDLQVVLAADAAESIINDGLAQAQNQFNG